MSQRLDIFLHKTYGVSRTKAADAIKQGLVKVNGIQQVHARYLVSESDCVEATFRNSFVSFGGYKLEAFLEALALDLSGFVCLDSGLSTGGFADCLLRRGAARVYGVDVGTSQVDPRLAQDARLIIMEQTNLLDLVLSESVDLITLDLSFVSLQKIVPHVLKHLKCDAVMIMLFKPQFEVGAEWVNKHGIVTNQTILDQAQRDFLAFIKGCGLSVVTVQQSLQKEKRANKEYFVYARFER